MTTLSKIGKNVGKAIGGSQSLEGQLGGTFLNNVAFGGTGVNVLTPPGQDSGQYTQDQVNAYLASLAQGGGGDTTGGGTIDSTGGSSGGSSSGGSDSLASAETDINRFMRDFGLDQASALAALQLQSLDASQAQANLGIQDYLKNFELNQQKTAADVERYKRAMAGL